MLFSFEFSISHFHHAHLVAILYALKQRYEQSTLFLSHFSHSKMSQSQEKHAKFSVFGSKRGNTGVFMHALNLRTQWIGFIFYVRVPTTDGKP